MVLIDDDQAKLLLEGTKRNYFILSDWIFSCLREDTKDVIPDDRDYELAFDEFEILLSLSFVTHAGWESDWAPCGSFGTRRQNREQILNKIGESLRKSGENSPYVVSRHFWFECG